MNQSQPRNPLHGITLKDILEYLVAEYGWERLGDRININCFNDDPSINSSLKFLRKTDWARTKVERLYLYSVSYDERHGKRASETHDSETHDTETHDTETHDTEIKKTNTEMGSVWDRALRDK